MLDTFFEMIEWCTEKIANNYQISFFPRCGWRFDQWRTLQCRGRKRYSKLLWDVYFYRHIYLKKLWNNHKNKGKKMSLKKKMRMNIRSIYRHHQGINELWNIIRIMNSLTTLDFDVLFKIWIIARKIVSEISYLFLLPNKSFNYWCFYREKWKY